MIFIRCYYKLSLVRPTFQISKNLNLNGTCIKKNYFKKCFRFGCAIRVTRLCMDVALTWRMLQHDLTLKDVKVQEQ